ncbi:MAG: aldehyde dehydrogenase family protein, partial [Cyclobacteriaceae bacterium]|nr:aldehyde dehydrogenase family protein [Cyclobacteriaceae bacterium]
PNVLGSTLLIEKVFREAGFPEGVFQNLIIETHDVESIIRHPVVKAVTLTGSDRAGSAVAALAGSEIKKSVLELGGSNAFIVLDDADLPLAVDAGVAARMQNNGQSCIAAKRFLIQRGISGTYIRHFTDQMKGFVTGDPLDEKTTLGPLARIDLAEKLEQQVQKSVEMGATCLLGGKRNRTFFEPTVLTGVVPGMPAFDEELFGPVAAFTEIDNLDHAIELSNLSVYGLGVSIFTHQTEAVIARLHQLEDGAVFVNEMVKSDPRLPFGGTKRSGFGRELSAIGIREFTNIKTVYIR